MFKPSIFSLFIGAACLSSGCIITSNDDGGTNTSNASDPTNGGDTGGQTSNGDETGETTQDDETTDAVDETGEPVGPCGWGPTNDPEVPEGYVCGGDGEDPAGRFAIECPADLEEGAQCGELTGVGCCDAEGNVWFCWDDGEQTLVKESCG